MKPFARLLAVAALLAPAGAAMAKTRPARAPVVVELYTAQGCASCGAADPVFDRLAERPDIVALDFAVDYWDYLGWKDTFAQPEFAERQRAYDKRLGPTDVYTPQVIVAGRFQSPGDQADDIDALVRKALAAQAPSPAIRMRPERVTIGAGEAPKAGADVWLVRYAPGRQTVAVKDGDNRGKVLERRDVARQLARLGTWTGRATTLAVPAAPEPGLAAVVLVQARRGGPILAARQASAAPAATAPR